MKEHQVIDHVVYASPDLDLGVERFAFDYGVLSTLGGRHPGFGTRNALIGLGAQAFLEIVGIDREQHVAVSNRFLRLNRDSPSGFVTWCARAERPLQETVRIARAAGLDLGEIVTMSRELPDGSAMSWTLTSPFANRYAVLPFYIDRGGAQNPATSLPPLLTLVSLTLVHPDPSRIRAILDALDEDQVEVEGGSAPALRVELRR
jgi:hypothetical protein